MGLVWIIFADPELFWDRGGSEKLGGVMRPGKLFCPVWVYCLGFGHWGGCLRDGHQILGEENQKALYGGR